MISNISRRLYSIHKNSKQLTINDLYSKYHSKKAISMCTAYDFITATWANHAGCDMILVGDSLAMSSVGYSSTTDISLDEFKYHVKSVCRSMGNSFIVVDVPFGSYESSIEKGIETCVSIMKLSNRIGGVKLEVGKKPDDYSLQLAKELCRRGIPVMGHIGLTPQRFHALSGYKVQGNKSSDDAVDIYKMGVELEKAGCFSLVLECVPHQIARIITNKLSIPTIGIGAGPNTSGQVLVQSDILGMLPGQVPKFVNKYTDLYSTTVSAIQEYIDQVSNNKFPEIDRDTFTINDKVLDEFIKRIET